MCEPASEIMVLILIFSLWDYSFHALTVKEKGKVINYVHFITEPIISIVLLDRDLEILHGTE